FLVIAGDLYDGDWRDFNTGLFFVREMGRLREAGIRVALLYGNHDAANVMTRALDLPENVHCFQHKQPSTIEFADLGVALHGQSFERRDVTDNIARDYPAPRSGMLNIGVLHTALEGSSQHASYAPCTVTELAAKGYDYWALGHVHQARVVHEAPYIVFPGNLQGRHVRECGPKGAYRVAVRDGLIDALEHFPCDTMRWAELRVAADGVDERRELVGRISRALEAAVHDAAARTLAARIVVAGRPGCYNEIVRDEERFIAEVRAAAVSLAGDRAWLEKIKLQIKPVVDADGPQRQDAVAELAQLLNEASDDAALRTQFGAEFEALIAKLPTELREDPDLAFVRQLGAGCLEPLLGELGAYVIAQVAAGEE
ncbi:MAG: DNA repair exonuclease, partial [Nitrococcus mobilis]|nr:DNA repair exonuclease [Nitrococcus mobilis]